MTADERVFMVKAIEEAKKSIDEDDRVHPRVGVVVVRDGVILAASYRGELGPGDHAEFTTLEKKLPNETLAGVTVYTTLEPCTTRRHPKVPCVERLIERKVERVVIGMVDPNRNISGAGLRRLREANIAIDVMFPPDLMSEIEELNRHFIRSEQQKPESRSSKTSDAVPGNRSVTVGGDITGSIVNLGDIGKG